MAVKNSQESRRGCFTWLFSVKKSVNERLARIRNSLRRKLAREDRLAKPLTPDDLENETGSPDLFITRVLASPSTPTANGKTSHIVVNDEVRSPIPGVPDHQGQPQQQIDGHGFIRRASDGNPDPKQVKEFVQRIIVNAEKDVNARLTTPIIKEDTESLTSSVLSIMANEAVKQSLTKIFNDIEEESKMAIIDDTASLSSGAISDMAEAVVSESLSKIIVNPDSVIE